MREGGRRKPGSALDLPKRLSCPSCFAGPFPHVCSSADGVSTAGAPVAPAQQAPAAGQRDNANHNNNGIICIALRLSWRTSKALDKHFRIDLGILVKGKQEGEKNFKTKKKKSPQKAALPPFLPLSACLLWDLSCWRWYPSTGGFRHLQRPPSTAMEGGEGRTGHR